MVGFCRLIRLSAQEICVCLFFRSCTANVSISKTSKSSQTTASFTSRPLRQSMGGGRHDAIYNVLFDLLPQNTHTRAYTARAHTNILHTHTHQRNTTTHTRTCIHIHIPTQTQTHTHTQMHTYSHISHLTRTQTNTTYTHTHTHTHIYIHTHQHAHTRTCTYIHKYTHTYLKTTLMHAVTLAI